jgi:pimeloyl-ACP methyl ester carboxylesterase/membrane protein DedA with SNARE-associated domain
VYAILLAGSLVSERRTRVESGRQAATITAFDGAARASSTVRIAFDDFPVSSNEQRPAVIILHGSPGRGNELGDMARAIQSFGYRVVTPDLPGFGESTRDPPSLSILSHAHEMLALMDDLHIHRAHIVGWSLGGGIGMHMADLASERIASLTLMASISDQQVEGTRSYFAEHAKYAAGYVAASVVRYGVPHFGVLRHFDDIRASMRNFWDTDMRPLTGIMQRLRTPTLILHGRHDFLVPEFAAEHSYDLIKTSRLVVTEHSHFYPFLQPELAATHMRPLFDRHSEPGVPALRQRVDLSPEPPSFLGAPGRWAELALRRAHWLTLVAGGVMLLLWNLRNGAVLLVVAVSFGLIDNGIAFAAMFLMQASSAIAWYCRGRRLSAPRVIGRGTGARTPSQWRELFLRRPVLTALGTRFVPREHETAFEAAGFHRLIPLRFMLGALFAWCLWMLLYVAAGIAASAGIVGPLGHRLGAFGLAFGLIAAVVFVRGVELAFTRHGRRRLRMTLTRLIRREYWPAELLYWPMAPFYFVWGLRYGPIAFTACNPGIDGGGGVIGESKKAILDAMPDAAPWILRSVSVGRDASAEARADRALSAIGADPALAFPVILKPDAGYRGFAVKLARGEADVREYFRTMHAAAIVQEYHPGPMECGVLWARSVDPSSNGQLHGRIFSITRKTFPVITGDGRRTLEQLIHRHERFHAQAGVFLERWAADRGRVLGKGESLRLAESGNHCQGTLFADGEDLITPELSARIDVIAQSLRGGLDIGRFDLRYESDEALRRGEGFKIIELNGVTGESTNIYDPRRSIVWAFRVTLAQWRLMYQLGHARMKAGHRPLPVRELFRRIREHKGSRSGSALAD